MSKLRDLRSEDHLHLVSVLPVPSDLPLSIKAVLLGAHRDSSSSSSREGPSRDSPDQHRGRVSMDSSGVDHPLPVSTDRGVRRHTASLRTANTPGTAISRGSSRKAAVSS